MACRQTPLKGTGLGAANHCGMGRIIWEKVYTVLDWYDGPRLGLADYHGHPHLYESRWDKNTGDWEGEHWSKKMGTSYYWLSPVTPLVFSLAMEDWSIWLRWHSTFDQGQVDSSAHPALPEDRLRQEEIKSLIGTALDPGRPDAFLVAGHFDLESDRVRWTQVVPQPGDC